MKIEEQNARSKKIQEEIQGLNEVQKNQTEDIARVAEQDAEEEQTENDKLSENHVLLRHAEQAANSFQSAKDIFKEIAKLTDCKCNNPTRTFVEKNQRTFTASGHCGRRDGKSYFQVAARL